MSPAAAGALADLLTLGALTPWVIRVLERLSNPPSGPYGAATSRAEAQALRERLQALYEPHGDAVASDD